MAARTRNTHRLFSLIVLFVLLFSAVGPTMETASAAPQADEGVRYGYNAATGKLSFVGASPDAPIAVQGYAGKLGVSAEALSLGAVAQYAEGFGLNDPSQELKVLKQSEPQNGRALARFQQVYQGIPVLGGELIVNTTQRGGLISISGEVSPGLKVSTQPKLSADEARSIALASARKWYSEGAFSADEPALWIYDSRLLDGTQKPVVLVWRMEVSSADVSQPVRELVLVDALKGGVALHFNQVNAGLARETDFPENSTQSELAATWPLYHEMAIDDAKKLLYASDPVGKKIDVISTVSLSVIRSIKLTGSPRGISLSPNKSELVVAEYSTGKIAFINLNTNKIIERTPQITVGGPGTNTPWDVIHGRALSPKTPGGPSGWLLYSTGDLTGASGRIHVFDTRDYTEIQPPTKYGYEDLLDLHISADRNTLYGYDKQGSPNSIIKFDASGDIPVFKAITPWGAMNEAREIVLLPNYDTIFTSGGEVWTLALRMAVGRFKRVYGSPEVLYIPNHDVVAVFQYDGILFLDAKTAFEISFYPYPFTTREIGEGQVTSSGSALFVSTDQGIYKVDLSLFPIGLIIPRPAGSLHYPDLAVDEARGVAYGANQSANRVDVVSLSTRKVIGQIKLMNGSFPLNLALSPDGNELAVMQPGANSIAFIDLTRAGYPVKGIFIPNPYYDEFEFKPTDMAYGRSGRAYAIADGSLFIIDTSAYSQVTREPIGDGGLKHLQLLPDQNSLYINSFSYADKYDLFEVDVSSDTPIVVKQFSKLNSAELYADDFVVTADKSRIFTTGSRQIGYDDVPVGKIWAGDMQKLLGSFIGAGPVIYLPSRNAIAVSRNFIDHLGNWAGDGMVTFYNLADISLMTSYRSYINALDAHSDDSKLYASSFGGLAVIPVETYLAKGVPFGPTRYTYVGIQGGTRETPVCVNRIYTCTVGTDLDADAAHRYAGQTWKLYYDKHNRDSLDNKGMGIISVAHGDDNKYGLYYWNGKKAIYTNGAPLADDIVGHELTHGVTQYELNLFNYYQSGAINDSFSDLWGEFLDQTNGAGNDTPAVKWLIGENLSWGAIRNMKNPPQFEDPDKMTSAYYYKGADDNGGVHTNSGVNNKAVFLLVDGGSFNGKTVTKLGWDKTAAFYYEAQTNLLTSGADYSDLYYALQQACVNLTGQKGIVAANCQQVKNSLDAVQMNAAPIVDYNPEAPLCITNTAKNPTDIFFDGFESGLGKWTLGSFKGRQRWSVVPNTLNLNYAASGKYAFYGNDHDPKAVVRGQQSDTYAAIKTGIIIPTGIKTFLHFKQAFGFDDQAGYFFDGGVLEYSVNNGPWQDANALYSAGQKYKGTIYTDSLTQNPLGNRSGFVADSHGYVSSRYDLTSLAGKTVRFRFRMGTDYYGYDFGWAIDDVRVYTCVPKPAAPALSTPSQNAVLTVYKPKFTWKPVAYAQHYQLQVATNNTFTALVINQPNVSGLAYTPATALAIGKTYYWRVRAVNAANQSGNWSTAWSFKTGLVAPKLLEPAAGSIPDALRPTFDWTDVTGAVNYSLTISLKADFTTPIVNLGNLTQSTYAPTADLPRSKVIYWRVKANGPVPSQWAQGQFSSPNPPGTPALLTPDNEAVFNTFDPVDLTWQLATVPTNFLHYQVQVAAEDTFSAPLVDTTVTAALYTLTVVPEQVYYWRVRAFNTLNQHGNWSGARVLRTTTPAPTLTAPAEAATVTTLRPQFEWENVSGATGYHLQISPNADFTSPLVDEAGLVDSTYTPSVDLPQAVTVYWRVSAVGANGESAWSSATFTIASLVLVSPGAGAVFTASDLVTFDWDDLAGASNYLLEVSTQADFSSTVVSETVTDSTYAAAAPFAVGAYYWRVTALGTGLPPVSRQFSVQ